MADRQHQASLQQTRKVGQKIKRPKKDSQDDVRRCFNKPEFACWQNIRLADLTPQHLITLLKAVHKARGHRACEKTLAYVKAALNCAYSEIESGLAATLPWWEKIKAPAPTEVEIDEMEARLAARVEAKEAFTVRHLGELLARHERFCAGRTGNQTISPGVRGGLWWLGLTANRRFTTTKLRRCDLQQRDPRNPHGARDQPWGVPEWPAGLVKNQRAFMLPIPPIGLHIANSCMWDWRLLIGKKRGFRDTTQWVFASTRRRHPDDHPANPDPSVFPNSLDAHLRAMRGRKKTGMNKTDQLTDLPGFWLHLVRSAMTNFFDRHRRTLHPAAASAMLGHVLPSDKDHDHRQMSKTTEEYYLTSQHMDLKADAMKLWSDALLEAYVKAGGTLPMPYEKDPDKPEGPSWTLPRLPGRRRNHKKPPISARLRAL